MVVKNEFKLSVPWEIFYRQTGNRAGVQISPSPLGDCWSLLLA